MLYSNLEKELETLSSQYSLRQLRNLKPKGKFVEFNNKLLVNTASNDYLGIGGNTGISEEFQEFLKTENFGTEYGACSSRLLTGNRPAYDIFENYLANAYSKEKALIFNSGYHANIGILPAISDKNDLIIADKYVHASLIDGILLSKATFKRFPHNNYIQLEKILKENKDLYRNIFVVTESIFSMDGDICELETLVSLKKKYNFYLYLDEAHSIGVCGETGLGLADLQGFTSEIDILVGTFGKAVASQGAFVVGKAVLIDYLINKMRSLIYTTGLPEINVLFSYFVFRKMKNMYSQRAKLFTISQTLRNGIIEAGSKTLGSTQIVPLIVGDNKKAVDLCSYLEKNNFLALPVRYPTVPKGSERIRFSLSSEISENDINILISLLKEYKV